MCLFYVCFVYVVRGLVSIYDDLMCEHIFDLIDNLN